MYQVIDIQTKTIVRTCTTRQSARKTAHRLDAKYGAVRYIVKCVD